MSVIDILFRVDEICKKYDKYDIDKQRELGGSGNADAFSDLYDTIESEIENAIRKSEVVALETNRAKVVAMNAEIRRTKARLLEEVSKLQKLAYKKVKGLSKDDMIARGDLALELGERIKLIPDGSYVGNIGSSATSGNRNNIKFDLDGEISDDFFQTTKESSQFGQEFEMRKLKQDEGLDVISEGLETLKNLAHDMNEELDRQVPLIDEIDTKVDRATTDLKNNNVRLKETLNKVRSSRNFFIDIILLCVILGIAAYLYNVLR